MKANVKDHGFMIEANNVSVIFSEVSDDSLTGQFIDQTIIDHNFEIPRISKLSYTLDQLIEVLEKIKGWKK